MSKKVLILYPKENYVSAVKKVGLTPVFDQNEPTDGLILTGGGDLSPCSYDMPDLCCKNVDLFRDQIEFLCVKKYLTGNLPIFGICRGMQVVNVFLGGSLHQNVRGHDQIEGEDRFHLVKNNKDSAFYSIFGESLSVNSAHHQAVNVIGEKLKILSTAKDGVIEALSGEGILLTQFHPERLGDSGLEIFRYFSSLL